MKRRRLALWRAFRDGAEFAGPGWNETVALESADVSFLNLPSGRIVVSDPLLDPWQPPFTTRVAPGIYSVHLAVGYAGVALVMVLFQEGRPIRWRRAKPKSFSVDSAKACVMDDKLARLLRRKADADQYDSSMRHFTDALDEAEFGANFPIGSVSDANVVLFKTWGGDGTFPVFFGYGARGELICLVIDMLIEPNDAEPVY